MAETSLFSVANRIIRRLQEIGKLRGGLDNSLQQLKNIISDIKGVLLHAEMKQQHDDGVKDWLRKVGDSLYDADELVDEYYTETLGQIRSGNKVIKQVCALVISTSNFSNKMRQKLKVVMEKLADLCAAGRDRFHLEVLPEKELAGVDATEWTVTPEYGREDDKKVITQWLFENMNDDVSVHAICGMVGSGKSALAQLVFNSYTVREHFQLRMWVELSSDDYSDLRLVVVKIINSAAPPHKQVKGNLSLGMGELQERLRKEIKGKRFLLIFNNFQNPEKWLVLIDLLTNGVKGNNIVVLIRDERIARVVEIKRVFRMLFLNIEDSWHLFTRVAFKQGKEPRDPRILELGRRAVAICSGHPFTISVIGRMLYFKDPETEWPLLLNVLKNSFGGVGGIFKLLMLCYNQLSSQLKHCFAFCSLFPEGYEIDVQALIKFWMAQGFIELSDSQCMEDVGYEYFLQLLSRFFFEIVKKDELGNITKCKINKFMFDLAKFAAGKECTMLSTNEDAGPVTPRHVSFNFPLDSSWLDIPSSLHQAKGIRTILLCNQSLEEFQEISSRKSICDCIVSRFKFLHMLDLHNSGLREVPSSIGKLKHLRYLDLSENKDIIQLPTSITMLQNLQTLKLSSCYGLREWPEEIRKLVNLRHLEFDWCYSLTRMPRGLGQLSNLQKLSEVVLTKRTDELSELKELNNLRGALKITKLRSGIQPKSANLEGKQYLSSLMLTWDFNSNDGDATEGVEKTLEDLKPHLNLQELALVGYEGAKFSSWLSSLTRLVKFSLRRCKCKHLPPLSRLPSLKILILDEMASLEYVSDSLMNKNEFSLLLPSLEELRLSELPNLRGWWREYDNSSAKNIKTPSSSSSSSSSPLMVGIHHMFPSLPSLSKLIVEDCPKLNSMPLYPNLKEWRVLDNTSWKPFQLTLKSSLMQDPSSSSSSALSELKTLCIAGIEELDKTDADEIDWKAFKSLHFLRLDYLPNLEVLPDGIQDVISLTELHIWRCNIETIPECISKLHSLKRLSILVCPYLTSLPKGIRSLTSLETLEIVDCPILLQRCQKKIGADWYKIDRIPNLLFPHLQSFSLISSLKNRRGPILSSERKTNLSSTTGSHS